MNGNQKTTILTLLALMAFAANSILTRLALADGSIDPAAFTAIRLVSGALVLGLLASRVHKKQAKTIKTDWVAVAALFGYAAAFSFAYLYLSAGMGALILFGLVQVTMLIAGVWGGERPVSAEWVGLLLAMAGLVYLVLPGLSAPSPIGSFLMGIAGVCWGVYSLRGRRSSAASPLLLADPLSNTARNFQWAAPAALILLLFRLPALHITATGVLLAALSGSVTSGIGYAVWYAALGGLAATRAALVQLSVPILAAAGGILFLSEALSSRLLIATAIILGGIVLAITSKKTIRS